MRHEGYELSIPEGQEDKNQYVALKHGQVYRVFIKNNNRTRCDAALYIDGKHQGTWRLEPFEGGTLEHPAHDQGKFTFYKLNSGEAQEIGLDSVTKSDLGLVKVTFTPEKERELNIIESRGYKGVTRGGSLESSWDDEVSFRGGGTRGYSAGGTGLSEDSDQEYGNANFMVLDESKAVTLHLRLVAKSGPRPLTEVPHSTPVPPPLNT